MMQVGILSDTHDQRLRTQCAVQLLKSEGAEALIHCGDLVKPDLVAICGVLPCYFVFGNNDAGHVAEIRLAISMSANASCLEWGGEVMLAGKRIGVTHGHSAKDFQRLMAGHPDYLCSGHSHIAGDWKEGSTRRINPGALHRASSFSVAILNLTDDKLRFLPIPR